MEVAAGRAAGRAHQADQLAAVDVLAGLRRCAGKDGRSGSGCRGRDRSRRDCHSRRCSTRSGRRCRRRWRRRRAERAGEVDAGVHGGAAAERIGADAEAAGEVDCLWTGRRRGWRPSPCSSWSSLLQVMNRALKLGSAVRRRRHRLVGAAHAGPGDRARAQAERGGSRCGGDEVALLGGLLDRRRRPAASRATCALHAGDLGAGSGAAAAPASWAAANDRPEERRRRRATAAGDLELRSRSGSGAGLAVMEENVARLEQLAEHRPQARVLRSGRHHLSPFRPPGAAATRMGARKSCPKAPSRLEMTSGDCPLRTVAGEC